MDKMAWCVTKEMGKITARRLGAWLLSVLMVIILLPVNIVRFVWKYKWWLAGFAAVCGECLLLSYGITWVFESLCPPNPLLGPGSLLCLTIVFVVTLAILLLILELSMFAKLYETTYLPLRREAEKVCLERYNTIKEVSHNG